MRAEEAQGLVRAVWVHGLGDVRVRVGAGEVLRLRHVVGGPWGRSVRTRRAFNGQHTFDQLGFERGGINVVSGGLGAVGRNGDEVRRDAGEREDSLEGGSMCVEAGDGESEARMGEVRRMEREALEARIGRGGYVVGAMWDEGNAVHAMRRFGGTTLAWRFGDG